MPTSEQRVQQLIRRGVMPSEAEQIVTESDAREGRLLSALEVDAAAAQDETTIATDRLWVFYAPAIPAKYKRLWTARTVQDA